MPPVTERFGDRPYEKAFMARGKGSPFCGGKMKTIRNDAHRLGIPHFARGGAQRDKKGRSSRSQEEKGLRKKRLGAKAIEQIGDANIAIVLRLLRQRSAIRYGTAPVAFKTAWLQFEKRRRKKKKKGPARAASKRKKKAGDREGGGSGLPPLHCAEGERGGVVVWGKNFPREGGERLRLA